MRPPRVQAMSSAPENGRWSMTGFGRFLPLVVGPLNATDGQRGRAPLLMVERTAWAIESGRGSSGLAE